MLRAEADATDTLDQYAIRAVGHLPANGLLVWAHPQLSRTRCCHGCVWLCVVGEWGWVGDVRGVCEGLKVGVEHQRKCKERLPTPATVGEGGGGHCPPLLAGLIQPSNNQTIRVA